MGNFVLSYRDETYSKRQERVLAKPPQPGRTTASETAVFNLTQLLSENRVPTRYPSQKGCDELFMGSAVIDSNRVKHRNLGVKYECVNENRCSE